MFWFQQYEDVATLGDTLVSFLTPHYSANEVTQLFLPDPYPMPLPPIPPLDDLPHPKPHFLPAIDSVDLPPLTTSALLSAPTKPSCPKKTKRLSQQTPDPPAARTLTAELEAEAAFQASAKECEA